MEIPSPLMVSFPCGKKKKETQKGKRRARNPLWRIGPPAEILYPIKWRELGESRKIMVMGSLSTDIIIIREVIPVLVVIPRKIILPQLSAKSWAFGEAMA